MGLIGSTPKMDPTEQKVRDEIDEQIAKYKIFMVSKKSCPFCRTAKVSFKKTKLVTFIFIISRYSRKIQKCNVKCNFFLNLVNSPRQSILNSRRTYAHKRYLE